METVGYRLISCHGTACPKSATVAVEEGLDADGWWGRRWALPDGWTATGTVAAINFYCSEHRVEAPPAFYPRSQPGWYRGGA